MIKRPMFVSIGVLLREIHTSVRVLRNAEDRSSRSIVFEVLPAGGTVAAFDFAERRHVRWQLG
jgi:hypothetical protein